MNFHPGNIHPRTGVIDLKPFLDQLPGIDRQCFDLIKKRFARRLLLRQGLSNDQFAIGQLVLRRRLLEPRRQFGHDMIEPGAILLTE